MPKFDSPLDNIHVASPCPADWNEMYGDGRKRFCGDCKLSVYNLSGMTRDEAEALIMNAEGRLCVRFYRRADGSIITTDCPVGWAKIRQRTRIFATAAASLLIALFTGVFFVSLFSKQKVTLAELVAIPFATPTPRYEPLMGAIPVRPNDGNVEVMGDVAEPNFTQGKVALPSPKKRAKFENGKMKAMRGEGRDG